MKLTEPQKRAVLYFRRSGLPAAEKMVELKRGSTLKDPDPRVTWKLIDMGLLKRGSGRSHWALTDAGRSVAAALVADRGAP